MTIPVLWKGQDTQSFPSFQVPFIQLVRFEVTMPQASLALHASLLTLLFAGVSPGPYRVYLATTVDSCTRERVVELTASVTGTESQTCRQVSPSLLDTLWPF